MASTPTQKHTGRGAAEGTHQVVAYLRVSTDRQAEEGLGLDIQEDQIRAFLTKHPNLKLVKIYRDKGISGSTLDRPALRELLADAKERRAFTRVIVAKLDRLARMLEVQLFIEKVWCSQKFGQLAKVDSGPQNEEHSPWGYEESTTLLN